MEEFQVSQKEDWRIRIQLALDGIMLPMKTQICHLTFCRIYPEPGHQGLGGGQEAFPQLNLVY